MRRSLNVVLTALLAAVGVTAAAFLLGGEEGYHVRAEFLDAAGLRKNSQVKIAGAPVGKVSELAVTEDDRALAVLEIDASAAPVGRDASVKVRPNTLLGEKYADLRPGQISRPVQSGTLIPARRTGASVELDDVLAVLDPDTRTRLGILINEAGIALEGRGSDLDALLTQLPPALDQAEQLVADLGADNRALRRLVVDSDRFLEPVSRERRSVGRFVDSAEGALTSVASRRGELGETVRRAPSTLVQLRSTLARTSRTSRALRPAATALRQSAPPLTDVLQDLPGFARAARLTLGQARAVAPKLTALGRSLEPFASELRPAARQLDTFARALGPVSVLSEQAIGNALGLMEGWSRAIQVRDAAGHLFRNQAYVTPGAAKRLVDTFVRPSEESSSAGSDRAPTVRAHKRSLDRDRGRDGAGPDADGRIVPPVDDIVPDAIDDVAPSDAVNGYSPLLLDYLLGP